MVLGSYNLQKLDEFTQKKFMAPMTAALQTSKRQEDEEHKLFNNYMQNTAYTNQPHPGNEGKENQDIEWEYCDYHNDRVKHFYCTQHQNLCCRVCKDIMHAKAECTVVDLYETDDIQAFLNEMGEFQKDEKGNSNKFENLI